MVDDPKARYWVDPPPSKAGYQSLAPADLAKLCTDNDPAAWEEFIRRYRRPIALVILRILRRFGDVPTVLVDDLVQDTYVAFCANDYRVLRNFVEHNPVSLSAMVRVVAANVTHDHIRSKASQKRGGGLRQVEADSLAVSNLYVDSGEEKVDRAIQLREIDTMLRGLSQPATAPRDRTIFWLHFRLGMSAKAIAQIPSVGLSPKGVESAIHRTLDLVRRTLGVDPRLSWKKKRES